MKLTTEIQPDQSQELLKALHILTRDGKLNQDSRRKLKQVNHLVQFIAPLIEEVRKKNADFSLVDHGAGKSYLGFMLYDACIKAYEYGKVIGIEARADLVSSAQNLAEKIQFKRMAFHHLSVEDSMQSELISPKVEIVTALHACNTATDDAIRFGLKKQAEFIILVPCCQAEVASVLRENKAQMLAKTAWSELWRHPMHTRELGSHLTNVLRCLQLEAHGYQVTVTELVGWEHSMKNELIVARNLHQPKRSAKLRLQEILQQFGLESLNERFACP